MVGRFFDSLILSPLHIPWFDFTQVEKFLANDDIITLIELSNNVEDKVPQ